MRLGVFLLAGWWSACSLAAAPDEAQRQVEAQDLGGAQRTLEARLAEQPQDAASRYLLARVLAWQGRFEEALGHYDRLLANEPDNADYLLGQGQALLWADRPQQALVPLERAARLAPDYAAVQQALAQARSLPSLPAVQPEPLPPPAAKRRHELELSLRHDNVDSGLDDWRTQRLDYLASQPEGLSWYGALVREQRFADWDRGLELGVVAPLDADWAVQVEGGYQAAPDFLPEWFADVRLQRRLPHGFLGAASLRRTRYADTRIDRLALSAERYWGSWRASYTLNLSDVEGGGHPVGHAVALDHYYAGLSYVGLRGSFGEEEGLEEGRVFTSDVRSWGLEGRHWFHPRWAFSWEVGHLRQGDFYSRDWLMLGLRHAF